MKILCLFVRHGSAVYPDALAQLDAWYAAHGLLNRRILWIIDNALPTDTAPRTLAPGVVLRPGDNSAWEFSAWDRSLREAAPDLADDTIVHCVTSAFHTLYTGYLAHFHAGMSGYVAAHRVALGHIDHYDRPVELAGRRSAAWIRTCFFFLRADSARATGPWAAFTEPAVFFESPDSTRFRADAPLCAGYRERLRTWLEGRKMGGHRWHSPVGAGTAEAARFQRKTLAILNEHNLTISLRAAGIPPTDFCWLHSQGTDAMPSAPPPEAEQLRLRRRILGIPEPAN